MRWLPAEWPARAPLVVLGRECSYAAGHVKITPFISLLWGLNLVLKCVLCAVIVRRRLHEEMPIFSWYTIASTVWDMVMIGSLLLLSYWAYFIAYWVFEGLSILFDCMILIELYRRILSGYEKVRTLGTIILRCSFVLLLMTGFSLMAVRPHASEDMLMGFLLVFSRSVKFMQLGLVVVVFGFVRYFRIPLKRQELGVAVGIGVIAAVNLAAFAVRTHLGLAQAAQMTNAVLMSGYAVGAMIWIWFLARPEVPLSSEEAPDAGSLRKWNKTLTEILDR